MNTSRDIEKLFDHFGGNAADYQEIGRENEAKSARTRWPLLATLDLAQPSIPEIAPRRETPVAAQNGEATPPERTRAPLFTRSLRRTIPVVTSTTARDALSASRFAASAETAEQTTDASAQASVPVVVATAPAPAPVVVASAPAPAPLAVASASSFARDAVPEKSPSSILGKLFQPTPALPESTPETGLNALFDRLRHAGDSARGADATTPHSRRSWGPRS